VGLFAPIRHQLDAVMRVLPVAAAALSRSRAHDLPANRTEEGLLASLADLVTRHGRNGQVVFASPAAEAMLGAAPRDLMGRGLFDRVHVADRPAYLTALSDAARMRESRVAEFRIRREATGSPAAFVWVEMRFWPLDGARDAGQDCEVAAIMRDITARKDEAQAIADARAEAERASVAKSRFLATMSHELRTPLNAIIGFSEMLREESTLMIDAKQRHDYAHLINESGQHLLAVVNGILDMSKIESGNFELMPEPVAVAKVIAECCELLALRARQAGVDIALDLDAALPRIIADKRALLQIMLNLLTNAIKFTDRGGKVTVSAKSEIEPEIGPDLAAEGSYPSVVITVADTGVGIPAQDLERVGEPFFQAGSSYDRRHDGTGLGVSIVKGLLALHGGGMDIESHVGEGTRIHIYLPIDCETARGAPASMLARVTRGRVARAGGQSEPASDMSLARGADTEVRKSA
jgi:cell cycle sensor histidine kinase DivJ